jgi:hypothetical protein
VSKYPLIVLLLLMSMFSASALSEETIFNVPSGDILDKGKVYGEFDFSYLWDAGFGTYTPRVVAGIGHRVEVGINVNGITSPGPSQTLRRQLSNGKLTMAAKTAGPSCWETTSSSLHRTGPTMQAIMPTLSSQKRSRPKPSDPWSIRFFRQRSRYGK